MYISGFIAFLILIILILLRPLIIKHSKPALVCILVCLVSIQINRTADIHRIKTSNELVVFNSNKKSLIGLRNGQMAYFFTSESVDSSKTNEYIIRPYLIKNRIKKYSILPIDTTFNTPYITKTKHVLYVNNTSFFLGENLMKIPQDLDYLIIRNSSLEPKNIFPLQQIKRVIADGSNYPNYLLQLDDLFKKQSDSVYWSIPEKGYFNIIF